MSKTLSSVARQEFDTEVKQAYQGMSNLRSTVTLRTGVVGDQYKFRKIGKGLANQKASQADVTPMDVSHSLQTATLGNWNAPEYTDIFDQAEVNFDEKTELAQCIAKAMVRREDQLIIDALAASGTSLTVANSIGGSNTNLNIAKLTKSSSLLNDKGVPTMDRHILVSASGLEALLNITEATSADYNTIRALVNGQINSYVGFTFHVIETRDEGGLTKDGSNDRTGFAYHKEAVGLAVGLDMRTEVDWIPQKTSWLTNGILKAGAVARDAEGIVEITTRES